MDPSMKPAEELLCSLDRSWNEFSKAWSKTRESASEKSVHALRVNTRRLIANLELARVLSKRTDIDRLQRRFKKVLKGMSTLRDIQVQLKTVSHVRKSQTIADFTGRLEHLEQQEIQHVPNELKRRKKRRLEREVKDLRSALARVRQNPDNVAAQQSLDRMLSARRDEFLKAKRRFQRGEPDKENALHDMRIAVKKLRYVMEAAQPMLGSSEKERAETMRGFQRLMGDTRDIEMLRANLEEWASKKGKKVAVVPALQQLEERREGLLKEVMESSDKLESMLEIKSSAPMAETTQLARAAAAAATADRR